MSVEIIAEIGVNHDGSFEAAVHLINEAHRCGCDTVKFQLFDSVRSYGDTRFADLELTRSSIWRLHKHCEQKGIRFLCTPDDALDADYLHEHVKVERFKLGSSNVTNLPLIRHIASFGKPLLLSTGAATWHEVCGAVAAIGERRRLTLMHCVSAYPADLASMNLVMIRALKRQFRVPVGLSDHTVGCEAALMAIAQDACVIEKHFTLSQSLSGPDHSTSLSPAQMRAFVLTIREAELAMGNGEKHVLACEEDNRAQYLKFVARQTGGNYAHGTSL